MICQNLECNQIFRKERAGKNFTVNNVLLNKFVRTRLFYLKKKKYKVYRLLL